MLMLSKAAARSAFRATAAMPGALAAVAGVLCFAAILTWSTWRSPLAQWWLVCVIVFQVSVLVWAQGVIVRLVLRHLMVGDDGGLAALQPNAEVLRVALTVLLTQIMALGPIAAIFGVLVFLNAEIGEVSTLLSIPLLAPLAGLGMIYALRFGLSPAPASLGLSEPFEDSWHITANHVLFTAGAAIITLGPPLAVALLLAKLGGGGLTLFTALVWSLFWVVLGAAQGGLTFRLYQRWRTLLRPDMRPCRNKARRLEPLLGPQPG